MLRAVADICPPPAKVCFAKSSLVLTQGKWRQTHLYVRSGRSKAWPVPCRQPVGSESSLKPALLWQEWPENVAALWFSVLKNCSTRSKTYKQKMQQCHNTRM